MGCICAKPATLGDTQRERVSNRISEQGGGVQTASLRREGSSIGGERSGSAKPFLIDRKPSGSNGFVVDHSQKSKVKPEDVFSSGLSTSLVPKSTEGEQVAAGWPSWLASAAGEALSGWIPRRVDSFEKLNKIGQGTYSSVYKAQDLTYSKTVALKRVRFDNLDPESVKFMAREIIILRKLDHPNIIKLEGLIASSASCSIYLIFEYMEHDLTGLSSLPGVKFTEPQVKCYMKQLLSGLEHCHSRGVLHRDIKGSNLLIDDSGVLKIADFGLAAFYDPSDNIPMTSRVVTLWYRPPELLLGATRYSDAVDLWSSGCILAELYAGKPLMPGRTEVEQLHKIFKLCGSPPEDFWVKSKLRHAAAFKPHQPYRRRIAERFKDIPSSALQLIEILLSIDPACRGTASSALNTEFFTTEPLACDPSSLPKYPPSKEIDAKMREDRIKRRQEMESRGKMDDPGRQRPEQREAALADKASADLVTSVQMQERRRQSFLRERNQTFNTRQGDPSCNTSFSNIRNRETVKEDSREILERHRRSGMYSGPLARGPAFLNMEKRMNDALLVPREAMPLVLPTSAAAARARTAENHRPGPSLYNDPVSAATRTRMVGRFTGLSNELDRSGDEGRLYHTHSDVYSNQGEDTARVARPVMDSFKHDYVLADEYKIHYSGPLMFPSKNVEDMLRERDRRLQEATRRARIERPNQRRVAPNQLLFSGRR